MGKRSNVVTLDVSAVAAAVDAAFGAAGKYREAPEVEEVARALIDEVADHAALATARIRYLMRAGPWTSRGRDVLGHAYVLSERDRLLSGADLLVVINADWWAALSPDQRRALVDHELSHFVQDDKGRWTQAGHDVEEFAAVIRRHGLWHPSLQAVATVIQERLPL